jgi:hypothetical protein
MVFIFIFVVVVVVAASAVAGLCASADKHDANAR